ncbi:MAG: hypothetical protein NWP80_01140 [Candidatus Gracilibacteria bacterium]|nr:hypothetical protein [Candidatus Gracilibacteria bacterium]
MKKIYLIDGNSFIYRMFFALPEFQTKDGTFVNGLFGMAKFFLGQLSKENPDYVCFIVDAKGKNFRHEIYSDYKATRDRMPDNLRSQISLIYEMVEKMGFEIISIPGFEADDTIGTLATKLGKNSENEVYILSGDKDLYSLTSSNVKIYDTMKQKIYDDELTFEKFEVKSKYVIDYLAICGDSADNIPGIPGFGPKKAIELINKYGTVEEIYKHVNDDDFPFKNKTLQKFIDGEELSILSKKLATIELNVDLPGFDIEKFRFNKNILLNEEVKIFFRKYEFFSLIGETEMKNIKNISEFNLETQNIENLGDFLDILKNKKEVYFNLIHTSLNFNYSEIAGLGLKIEDINYYIDFRDFDKEDLISFIKTFFNLNIEVIGFNLKLQLQVLNNFLDNDFSKNKTSSQIILDF